MGVMNQCSGRGQRWPPASARPRAALGLLQAAAVVDARGGEAGLERGLGGVALADRTERGGVGAVRGDREEGLRRRALERAEDLDLVADLLAALEVESHLALCDYGGGFDHGVVEGDAGPVEGVFHLGRGSGGAAHLPLEMARFPHAINSAPIATGRDFAILALRAPLPPE